MANVDLETWAQLTQGWNGADLALLSNQAALSAIRRYRAQGLSDPSQIQITNDDFQATYQMLASQRQSQ